MAAQSSKALTTPPVRVSYPNIFKMQSFQGGKESYSIRIMFDKKDKTHMNFLKELADDMKQVLLLQWPDEKTRPRIPLVGDDKSPIKDGDKNRNQQGIPYSEKNPEVTGHYFLNASKYTEGLPVVDRSMSDIITPGEIYGGCICRVNINTYARTRKDNPGISIGLNGVQKWADAERFGGGPLMASEMFNSDDDTEMFEDGGIDNDMPF